MINDIASHPDRRWQGMGKAHKVWQGMDGKSTRYGKVWGKHINL